MTVKVGGIVSRRRIIGLFMGFCLMVPISGCATLRELLGWGIEKPRSSLKSVSITELSFDHINLQITLAIENPNSFRIGMEQLEYQVRSTGLTIGHGDYHQTFEVEAKSQKDISIPFVVDPKSVLEIVKRFSDNPKDLMVQVVGTVKFKTPYGALNTEFDEKKRLLKGLEP